MEEQLNLFDTAARISSEADAFDALLPAICSSDPALFEKIKPVLTECNGYHSVSLGSYVIMRLRFGRKVNWFSVPEQSFQRIPSDQRPVDYKAVDGFVRIGLDSPADVLRYYAFIAEAARNVVDLIPKQFDCCSRYNECSNFRQCVNPYPDLVLGCGYRKLLARGIVYYGDNQNV